MDPVEKVVEDALKVAGVEYTRPEPPDFLLSNGVEIECKRMYTDRVINHLKHSPEVIIIQGLEAAKSFAKMVK